MVFPELFAEVEGLVGLKGEGVEGSGGDVVVLVEVAAVEAEGGGVFVEVAARDFEVEGDFDT